MEISIKFIIEKIHWLRPILCMLNKDNFDARISLLCECLAVNQKYKSLLQTIAPFCTHEKTLIELLPLLMFETTYLTFESVMEMFQPTIQPHHTPRFLTAIFKLFPTLEMVQTVKQYLHLEYHDELFPAVLETQNTNLCLATWKASSLKDLDYVSEDEIKWLCIANNPDLAQEISQKCTPMNLHDFYVDIVFRAAIWNKYETFQAFYKLAQITDNDILGALFVDAVEGGGVDIVKFCLRETKEFELDCETLARAYASGNVSLIELLKQHDLIPIGKLKRTAERYFKNFNDYSHVDWVPMNLNPQLLREMLNEKSDESTIMDSIAQLVSNNESQRFSNVDEEIFRIFAEFAPDLEFDLTSYLDDEIFHEQRVIWCLTHFKKICVPSQYFTKEQLLELMFVLDSAQFVSKPTARVVNMEKELHDSINSKRIVYLFFAKETELRDNAELILEYMH